MLDANVVGSVLQRLREERGLSQEIVRDRKSVV